MEHIINGIRSIIHGDDIQALLVAIAIIALTAVLSAVITRVIRRIMRVDGLPVPSSSILVNIARIVVWLFGLSVVLSACFGVDVNGLIAALGIGGVALSLGLQDTIKNFIGGLQVTVMGIVHPGDHVIIDGIEGIVQDVSWRQTVVQDYEHNVHLIPNALVNSTSIEKIEPDLLVATLISFVTDGRDLDEVVCEMEQLAKRAVEKVAPLEKDPWILMTQLGEYGMWAKLRFVLKDATYAREARDAALRAIAPYTRLDAAQVLLDSGDED